MCERAVEKYPGTLEFVPSHLKTQEMFERAVEKYPLYLSDVSDHFKTQDMCDKPVRRKPWSLKHVPDLFVTEVQIKLWHDDAYYCNDNEMIEWYRDYQKGKAQKAKIKDELMPKLKIKNF